MITPRDHSSPAPPRRVRGVIFDLGGTLVHINRDPESDRERLQALRKEHGESALRDLVERPARQTIAAGLREAGVAAGEEFLERAERLLFEPDRGRALYPGARELLNILRDRGVRVGLISNWSSHWIVSDIVAAAGIDDYFAPLVSSASFGRIKPHPSIFRHVLETWGLGADDTVMVGDTLDTDILGASRLGMRSILVEVEPNPANAAMEGAIRPTYRAARLLDVPALLSLAAAPG